MTEILAVVLPCVVAFGVTYCCTPLLIRYLAGRSHTVPDCHREGLPPVPRPAGPALLAGILSAEAVLYWFVPDITILALCLTTALAFLVGLVDDMRRMGGWFKPLGLAAASAPLLVLGTYDGNLAFPLFGEVAIPLLYMLLIPVMISIMGNTVNSIDVFGGLVSGVMAISGAALAASILVLQYMSAQPDYMMAVLCLPLVFASLAYYRFHKYPSRIFPGDSGALLLGGMYGAIAIIAEAEFVAAVAVLPLVVNSFMFLSSVKKIVEHREVEPQTETTPDMKLRPVDSRRDPSSLVRLIISAGPMSGVDITRRILRMTAFSSALAVTTAVLMGIRI